MYGGLVFKYKVVLSRLLYLFIKNKVIKYTIYFLLLIILLILSQTEWPSLGYSVSLRNIKPESGLAWVTSLENRLLSEDEQDLFSNLYVKNNQENQIIQNTLCNLLIFIQIKPDIMGCQDVWIEFGSHHQPHKMIREFGGGRFSVWHGDLYFSTPTGSDPRSDGNQYLLWVASPWRTIIFFFFLTGIISWVMQPLLTCGVRWVFGFFRSFRFSKGVKYRRGIYYIGCALVGFIGLAVTLRELVDWADPLPYGMLQIRGKILWYRQHYDEIDTIFIGTSRVMNGVDPRLFDRIMTDRGCPTRSFNFSIAGLTYLQQISILEEITHHKPQDMKKIIFEPRSNSTSKASVNTLFQKSFMDLNHFLLGFQEAWLNPEDEAHQIENFTDFFLSYLEQRLGVGTVGELYEDMTHNYKHTGFIESQKGYASPSQSAGISLMPHEPGFPDNANGIVFKQRLMVWSTEARNATVPIGQWAPIIDSLYRILDRMPGEKIALLPPSVYQNEPAMQWFFHETRPQTRVIFPDPTVLPTLYTTDYWYDNGHLNEAGSVIYSQWLGEQLCPKDARQTKG